jgi:hypothetical protein
MLSPPKVVPTYGEKQQVHDNDEACSERQKAAPPEESAGDHAIHIGKTTATPSYRSPCYATLVQRGMPPVQYCTFLVVERVE